MKLNNADNYEPIKIHISKDKHPIVWENRVQSLMNSGLNREEAENAATGNIDLELYYDPNTGLFAVESEAVESGCIYNPYDGHLMEKWDD